MAYLYFADDGVRRRDMQRLTRDEALRIAANITKLRWQSGYWQRHETKEAAN